jgi:hypothetical protein
MKPSLHVLIKRDFFSYVPIKRKEKLSHHGRTVVLKSSHAHQGAMIQNPSYTIANCLGCPDITHFISKVAKMKMGDNCS